MGAGNQYSVGNTGGSDTVQLTVDEMPSHTHQIYDSGSSNSATTSYEGVTSGAIDYTYDNGYYNYADNAGGDQAHENRPPYYALAYIMKT